MFKFKHFSVRQDLCAMKVGTDGVLLGAWAKGGDCILDVGTGTGLIALMMAQRYPDAQITAIDIDEGVKASPAECGECWLPTSDKGVAREGAGSRRTV